ncbi:MAG TPA: biotin carboxylase N-terminal domain-containing protein [Burkholderiales bacterium]|nr:biotin carboxylase N-terminal domain-containing protein [Burkholderiales bacterium]
MFRSLLIANRGEIALRVLRTARRLGLRTVAVYSEADRDARHAREADDALCIGGAAPRESYLDAAAIVAAARRAGAEAVHPGYGFLAESAAFAQAVLDAGLVWVGPPPAAMHALGDKAAAKRLAGAAGVPVLPGYDGAEQGDAALARAARDTGYPLMIKAAAGGGGRGMRLVRSAEELAPALAQARSEAQHAFGDARVLLERALAGARHVEVQIFADTQGNCVHLGERDCSLQRRHQKLIEESPSPAVHAALRERLAGAALAVARAAGYVGAGTIEFLLGEDGRFWFIEANARLQVEHPVTELLTGLDLVEWQLRVAAGEQLPLRQQDVRFDGHAIEARLCAEDPARGFLPQSGRLHVWRPAAGVRVDHALEHDGVIAPHYDSLLAKLIAHGATRDEARVRLAAALEATVALGVTTNQAFLAGVLRDPQFARAGANIDFVALRCARVEAAQPDAALLAIGAALLAESAAGYGEWRSWSNNPARLMRARFGERDVALTYSQGAYAARIDGASVALRFVTLERQRARVELDGGREESVAYALEGEVVHLARTGRSWRLENVLHAPPAKRAAELAERRLVAPMNGRVVAVHVRAGDEVAAGAALIVLEAMKMEHGLSAPAAASVRAVHVAPGAQVAPGQVLLELEPPPARRATP